MGPLRANSLYSPVAALNLCNIDHLQNYFCHPEPGSPGQDAGSADS